METTKTRESTILMEDWKSRPAPVLLYDGLCGFCDATVQFVLARDRTGAIRFAPLQGEFAAAFFQRHPELRKIDSLILVETDEPCAERVYARSEAVVRIGEHIGGGWRAARWLRIVPRPIRDFGYDMFARIRYRVFGKYDACPIPSPEVRARFLP
jgi:predicted DCC family thiol-disulfide oxidoreductase YuxK